jgi:transposase
MWSGAANKAMEYVRKATHKTITSYQVKQLKHDRKIMLMRRGDLNDQQRFILETWLGNFADLGQAYLLKESFYDLYSFPTKYEAEMAYQVWLDELNKQSDLIREAFSEVTTFMSNWHDEIFNYFDVRATNAYTESLNGLLKQIYRNGRGYSFKAIRAKVLYGKIDHQR